MYKLKGTGVVILLSLDQNSSKVIAYTGCYIYQNAPVTPQNSDNKLSAYICSKSPLLGLFSGELIFGGACYRKECCVSKWIGLDNKNS